MVLRESPHKGSCYNVNMTFEEAVAKLAYRGRELGSGPYVGAQEISPVSEEEIIKAGYSDPASVLIGIALRELMESPQPEP